MSYEHFGRILYRPDDGRSPGTGTGRQMPTFGNMLRRGGTATGRWPLWIATLIILGLWSVFGWGVYGLIEAAGNFLAGHAEWARLHPEVAAWGSWLAGIGTDVGLIGVFVIWLVGSAAIVLAAIAFAWFLRCVRTRGDHRR
jgi:hypothetical protein